MKLTLAITIYLITYFVGFGQGFKVTSRQWNQQEVDSVFTPNLKYELQIDNPIHSIYQFIDRSGKHFIVFTENEYLCEEREKCVDSIQAFCFSHKDGLYDLEWSFKDFILAKDYPITKEISIAFWNKYFELDDYDYDGLVDPIIVYGTTGANDTSDGRLKILVYHNGKKRAIRHQNGSLDFQRNTRVDEMFYTMPLRIRNRVEVIMKAITKNNDGIFPYNWQSAMKKQKLYFDEN